MNVSVFRGLYSALAALLMMGVGVGQTRAEANPHPLTPVPEAIASFGAVISDGYLYLYSGHIGAPHDHNRDNVSKSFRRLNLANPGAWEELGPVPGLQSPGLVADAQGRIYRIGGMAPRNAPMEDEDLISVADVQRYDPKKKEWETLPSLPEPRSSHDAVIVGSKIYVAGGWTLAGQAGEASWLNTAWVLDTDSPTPEWQPIAEAPFQRRALAMVAAKDKLYAIGGMNSDDGPSQEVHAYDLATNTWSLGPAVPGEKPMHGFGISGFQVGGRPVISGLEGVVYRLDSEGSAWQPVAKLESPRFFHRIVPVDDHTILVVAGASMQKGKLRDIERVELQPATTTALAPVPGK